MVSICSGGVCISSFNNWPTGTMKLLFVISYLMGVLFPAILCGCSSDPNYGEYDNDTNYEDGRVRFGIEALLEHQEELWMDMENGNTSNCPELYQRFSTSHTYCKKSTCDIITSGVTEADKKFILEMHNSLRNKLALGNENRYRNLPPAANMMQMEWDDELALVAQAHANLCIYKHESHDERKVENFYVGQNLLLVGTDSKLWELADGWYKQEVCFYLPNYNHPFHVQSEYGHFTQITWANTWKLGCGFTAYRDRDSKYGLYTCNYGPSGNWIGGTFYITGEPCSQCPKNTNCSKEYPGLCKSSTENGPQRTKLPSDDFLLICDFSEDDTEACNDVIVTGPRNFTTRHMYTGDYKTVVLEGGESMTIDLGKTRNKGGVCPFVYIQYGPNKAKDAFGSKVKIEYNFRITEFPRQNFNHYHLLRMGLGTNRELKIKFMLEVEEGAAPQYFNIQAWGIIKGRCKDSIYSDSV